MELSIFFARFLGISLIVMCAGILLNLRFYGYVWQECKKHPIYILIFGLFDLFLGLFIVLLHNLWIADWRVLITLLGWFLFIRGAFRVIGTVFVQKISSSIKETQLNTVLVSSAIIFLLIGLFLTYSGFWF